MEPVNGERLAEVNKSWGDLEELIRDTTSKRKHYPPQMTQALRKTLQCRKEMTVSSLYLNLLFIFPCMLFLLSLTHTHEDTHTHTNTHMNTHTHTYTHTRTHTHTYTRYTRKTATLGGKGTALCWGLHFVARLF